MRFAQNLAHGGLAAQVAFVGAFGLAQGGHQVDDRAENLQARVPLLKLLLPPAFAVRVAGDLGHGGQRVAAHAWGVLGALLLFGRQRVPQGQIHETHRHAVGQRPADRLPLGRELRKRVERRVLRLVGPVEQQCHGRAHLRVGGEREEFVGVGRTFHQHRLRADGLQRRHDAARRARAVVTNPEDVRAGNHAECFSSSQP